MGERTVGQEQDDAAFEELLVRLAEHTKTGFPPHWCRRLRVAFDAGMRHQEKRGCCQSEDDVRDAARDSQERDA